MMEALKVKINGCDIYFEEDPHILQELQQDDSRLIDYVYRAVKMGKLVGHGILVEDADSGNITIEKYLHQEFTQKPTQVPNNYIDFDSDKENNNVEDIEKETSERPKSFYTLEDFDIDEPTPQNIPVWQPKRKSSIRDIEATRAMLEIRGNESWKAKFNNKKHNKLQLWGQIGDMLNSKGFYVGCGKEGAERCRQKFANLQKTYIQFISNQKQTGAGFQEPPPFYEELNAILGSKDKVKPQNLLSSMDKIDSEEAGVSGTNVQPLSETCAQKLSDLSPHTTSTPHVERVTPAEEDSNILQHSTTTTSTSKRATESVRPATLTQQLLTTMNTIKTVTEEKTKEIMEQNRQQAEMFAKHFEKQEENQTKFIHLFEILVKNSLENKKRKRRRSSSEDE